MNIDLNTWDPKGKKVLLYSSGLDSWLIDKLWKPDIKLFVKIGTASSVAESYYVYHDVVIAKLRDLKSLERSSDFILPSRNLYLITLAANYGDHICLGANATDLTHDKTEEFAEKVSDLLTYMYQPQKWTEGREIKVTVEYRKYTKSQLLKMYLDQGGRWQPAYFDSFSCYTPRNGDMCHACRPCFLKLMAFEDNDIMLTKSIVEPYVKYIKEKLAQKDYNDRLYTKEQYANVLRKYGFDK